MEVTPAVAGADGRAMTKERMTYGRKYLLDLIGRHVLARFCGRCLKGSFSLTYVSQVAHGAFQFPSLRFICRAAGEIAPSLWFYYTDEPLPDAARDARGQLEWRPLPDYGAILDVGNFAKWCGENKRDEFSTGLFASYICARLPRRPQMRGVAKPLSVGAFAAWCKKNGVSRLSARALVDFIYDGLSDGAARPRPFDFRLSRNFKKLSAVGDLRAWCAECGQKHVTVDALLKGRRSLTPQRVMAMRKVLPPEDWFR